MKIFCETMGIQLNAVRFTRGAHGREGIIGYIEGRTGHYLLCPKLMVPHKKVRIENSMDVAFPDGTTAMAQLELELEGNLMWAWKITWERETKYIEW